MKVLKLCDGAIAYVSTVVGGCWAGGEEPATPTDDILDSDAVGGGSDGGARTYVVVASEDGAVRFYDLKFRVEVSKQW